MAPTIFPDNSTAHCIPLYQVPDYFFFKNLSYLEYKYLTNKVIDGQ